jgi:hypothetical protein
VTVPTNTLQTYQSSNNAEDVSDVIMNVSPFDTPLLTMAKKGKAEATYTEWPIESLAAVDTANANIEGDDASIDASTTPTRVGNYCQLQDKTLSITTTQQAIRKYGVGDEWAHQKVKKGRELKNDMEATMFLNQARVVGAAGTAQKMRSLPAWITTNDVRGASGADGSTSAAATDGTQRNFTEALFKQAVVNCATNAGEMPSVVMAGIVGRANLSSQLSGNTTKFKDMADGKLNASITVYRSDYGDLKLVPNRRMRERDMFFLNPDYLEIRTLEPIQFIELGRTGLQRKAQMWTNWTLAVLNEAAHGVLADLNTAIL